LDRPDGFTGAIAATRRTLNGRRGVEVVAIDLVQTPRLLERHERRIGDHVPTIIRRDTKLEILGKPAELWRRLDIDFEVLAKADEAVLPGAADDDGKIVHRFADRYPLLHGHVVVDNQLILRVVTGKEGEQALHLLALRQGTHELVGH